MFQILTAVSVLLFAGLGVVLWGALEQHFGKTRISQLGMFSLVAAGFFGLPSLLDALDGFEAAAHAQVVGQAVDSVEAVEAPLAAHILSFLLGSALLGLALGFVIRHFRRAA